MALIKVTLPTALPAVRQVIGELGKAVKETGGLPGLETALQSLDALEVYCSGKSLDMEVVVVSPAEADAARRVANWIGAGFPVAPLQSRAVEPTSVELPGGQGLVPLRARIRSITMGAAVAAGTPRPAVLVLLVGNVTGLHPENLAAIESLLEDRPSAVVIAPPGEEAVKRLDERARTLAWTVVLADVASLPETSFQARLASPPWDSAHDLFRAHSAVAALQSLTGVFDLALQQWARDMRTKKAATLARLGKGGPAAGKPAPGLGADLMPEIKTRIQRHLQEFERGAVERLQDLLGLPAGALARETEAMLLSLDEMDEKEGTTKIETRIPQAFEHKLVKTIRERIARHCAGDVVALNDLFRLLGQEIERVIAQSQGPPFVPHFNYLTEDRVRRLVDMTVAIQAQYRGELPHQGFSEYFSSVRKYSMILVMAASMFGMSSVMRQYREYTVPLTILLVLGGTYSVVTSTKQQRVENLEKDLEGARNALRPDLRRIFSDAQKGWSAVLLQHMNEQISAVLAEVDTAIKDFQVRRGAEASPEKERLQRQLAQLELAEKKLPLSLKAKDGIQAAVDQIRGDLRPLFPKPGVPGAAKAGAVAAAAAGPASAAAAAIQEAKAKMEALKAQAAARAAGPAAKPAAPVARPTPAAPPPAAKPAEAKAAEPAPAAKPSALDEAKAKFAALRAAAAEKKPAPDAGKPSALDEAKARFEALKKQAEERKAAAAARAAAPAPAAKPATPAAPRGAPPAASPAARPATPVPAPAPAAAPAAASATAPATLAPTTAPAAVPTPPPAPPAATPSSPSAASPATPAPEPPASSPPAAPPPAAAPAVTAPAPSAAAPAESGASAAPAPKEAASTPSAPPPATPGAEPSTQ